MHELPLTFQPRSHIRSSICAAQANSAPCCVAQSWFRGFVQIALIPPIRAEDFCIQRIASRQCL